jgi:hypothetical protein
MSYLIDGQAEMILAPVGAGINIKDAVGGKMEQILNELAKEVNQTANAHLQIYHVKTRSSWVVRIDHCHMGIEDYDLGQAARKALTLLRKIRSSNGGGKKYIVRGWLEEDS